MTLTGHPPFCVHRHQHQADLAAHSIHSKHLLSGASADSASRVHASRFNSSPQFCDMFVFASNGARRSARTERHARTQLDHIMCHNVWHTSRFHTHTHTRKNGRGRLPLFLDVRVSRFLGAALHGAVRKYTCLHANTTCVLLEIRMPHKYAHDNVPPVPCGLKRSALS